MSKKTPPLAGRRIVVLTPAYKGLVHKRYMLSLDETRDVVEALGGKLDYIIEGNRANHVPMRNRMLNLAYAHFDGDPVTDFFFIDHDVAWTFQDFLKVLDLGSGVSAACPRLNVPVNGQEFGFTVDDSVYYDEKRHLIVSTSAPTAFMRIKREAIKQMIAAYPDTKYRSDGTEMYALFDAGVYEGNWVSEDVLFCARWRAIGGQVWIAADANLLHFKEVALQGTLEEFFLANWKLTEVEDGETSRI